MADTLHLSNKMPPSYSIFQCAPSQREDLLARMRPCGASRLILPAALVLLLALAPICRAENSSSSSSLPDAPQPQVNKSGKRVTGQTNTGRDNVVFTVHVGPGYPAQADKWDTIIDPGERAQHLSAVDKLLYAGHEQIQPVVFAPALLSAAGDN